MFNRLYNDQQKILRTFNLKSALAFPLQYITFFDIFFISFLLIVFVILVYVFLQIIVVEVAPVDVAPVSACLGIFCRIS